jgi:hypothetical protein
MAHCVRHRLVLIYSTVILIVNNIAQTPENVRIVSTDKDFLRLSWTKPHRFHSIYGYTIKYRPVHANMSWIVRQTNETQISLHELRPITKYEIILQAYSNSSYTDSAGPSTRIEATTDETGNVSLTFIDMSTNCIGTRSNCNKSSTVLSCV